MSLEARRPTTLFWYFVTAHVLLWTILPIVFHPNAPLDVVEQISWGREWQLGYYKHPPLASWLTNGVYEATGGSLWGIFLLSQACVAVCFWAVWRLARDIVDEYRALAAVLLLEGITYFSISAPEFNPNVLQLPIWALFALCAWRAIVRRSTAWWLALGLLGAAGLWTKYYTAVLLLAFAVFVFADREARKALRTPGPYLATIVSLLAFAPHLMWMARNDWITLTYAETRAQAANAFTIRLLGPLSFAVSQLPALVLMLIGVFVAYRRWSTRTGWRQDLRARYLAAMALGPFVVTVIIAVLLGWRLRAMWGTPLWSLLPLLLVALHAREDFPLRRMIRATAVIGAVLAIAFAASLYAGPYLHRPRKALFAGNELGAQITQQWRSRTGQPLRFVVGDTWLAGNVAFYSLDRPSTLTDGDFKLSPWVAPADLASNGGVVVWDGDKPEPSELLARFPSAQIQQPLALPWHTRAQTQSASVGWALVPASR